MDNFNGMSPHDRQLFFTYLKNHEYDIAIDENDFGDLKGVFKLIVGREPKED